MNFDISSHQEFSKSPICVLSKPSRFCLLCVIVSCTMYQIQHLCISKTENVYPLFRQRLEPIFEF
ncbi:hypothetical protein HanXRQr2_Chr09g0389031 [Helianthus annuus]|uniref:Uncharacterized protein n=1 Tax=Helianthus annuus TaxID=4232 RepID=A0A9K3N8C1_HELAN|nr:hypothetical protein HanXRQr2_Chr09g0389031 [Helianthus annuus]KAJ0893198.1 hypothetical protein HanPSC8_Chr09g0374911 [Helianthus annuus]